MAKTQTKRKNSTPSKSNPMDLKSIALGSLVGQVREAVVEFFHDGKIESVEIRIKQLPYIKTEAFHKRMNNLDDKVIAEWIAEALVDDDGKLYITAEQVEQHFTQPLVSAIYTEVSGLKQLQEYTVELGKASAMKMNSGQNSSSTELAGDQ